MVAYSLPIPGARSKQGLVVISLNCEPYWGLRFKWIHSRRGERIMTTRAAIPMISELFNRFEIHVARATVGPLFFDTKRGLPNVRPGALGNIIKALLGSTIQYVDRIGVTKGQHRWK